jgi:hypothetical protein
MPLILKYFIAWFPMIIIAILNGSLRQFVYAPFMNELTAHQISTFSGIILFGIYIYFVTKFWRIKTAKEAIYIGLLWLCMTILFEFVFGHYVMGHPWQRLFHDYNIFTGRIWILMLIWTTIAPYIFFRLHNK